MDFFKRTVKSLLFPPVWVMILLIPLATFLLIFGMVVLGVEAIPTYLFYVLSAYTLTVWCIRTPRLVKSVKRWKQDSPLAQRWFDDVRLRTNVLLLGSLIWNVGYAVFQMGLGLYHRSFWFGSIGMYYLFLACMRSFLAWHTGHYMPGARRESELKKYCACGWTLLLMNTALVAMIFFMIYFGRTFRHHEITTIAMAAYTFTAFTAAIVSIVRYRKYDSPVLSASKAISLAAASVSMLTLGATMLTTFGGEESPMFRTVMLTLIGTGVSLFILTMAIYMIVKGNKKIKLYRIQRGNE